MVCLIAGYVCRITKVLNDGAIAALTDLLIKITLPCTIFVTMMRPFSTELFADSLKVLGIFTAIQFLNLLFGFIIVKMLRVTDSNIKHIWMFAITFGNVGYMGYPVINAVFGESALIYASMVNISYNVLVNTLGIRLIDPRQRFTKYEWRRVFITPVMISTVLGFICFTASLHIPVPITNGIKYIADMTTPVSMLLLGAILGKSSIRGLFTGWKVYVVLLVRHFILPLTVLVILKPIVHNYMALSVIVLLCAMPAASFTAIFAQKYNSDAECAARTVFISTFLSLISVPIISMFL